MVSYRNSEFVFESKSNHPYIQIIRSTLLMAEGLYSNGKCGYPWGSTLNLYHHVPTMYGVYRAYGEIFGEQTARVLSQGYPHFPCDASPEFFFWTFVKHRTNYLPTELARSGFLGWTMNIVINYQSLWPLECYPFGSAAASVGSFSSSELRKICTQHRVASWTSLNRLICSLAQEM